MSLSISMPEKPVLKPKIVVFGVGGGGCNAVNNMIGTGLEGVDFVVANTDAQSLEQNRAERCIQMGIKKTQGLGAGSSPEVGAAAAEEVLGDISDAIHGAHMVFVTAGMGGGTGTGAAPVVARVAKEMGALTVGVITKPFLFEGNRRMRVAEAGITEMEEYIDTLLVIPNQNLFRVAEQDTSFSDAFMMADKVLLGAVGGITNLMVRPGIINLDFADVRTVMGEMGKAMIGTGIATGEGRAIDAAEQALNNPLLDDVSMKGARGVLISISASDSMRLYEVEEAMQRIRSEVDDDALIIPGTAIDESLGDSLRISVVATGIGEQQSLNLPEPEVEGLKVISGAPVASAPAASAALAPEANAPAAVSAMTEEKPPVFQVVSPPPAPEQTIAPTQGQGQAAPMAPMAPSSPAAQSGAQQSGAPQSGAQQSGAPQFTPQATPQAEQSGTGQSGADEYAAGGVYPFTPVESNEANEAQPEAAPKGFFGRMKAKLARAANSDGKREVVAARKIALPPASTMPSTMSAPMAAPLGSSPAPSVNVLGNSATPESEEDQMEIPSFLKSQAN